MSTAPLLGLGPGGWIAFGVTILVCIISTEKSKKKMILINMIIIIKLTQIKKGQMDHSIHIIIILSLANLKKMLLKDP